jgi:hypothetical protein
MTTKRATLAIFCSAVLLAGIPAKIDVEHVVTGRSASSNPFRDRVAEYTQLRRQVIGELLESGIDPNAADGREFRQQLGLALREARRQSQPGEIFCADVAGHMRRIVWNALLGEDDILSEVPTVPGVRVNDFYPEGEPLATVPPSLLQQFEPLPPELQYRFLSNALILLDIDTALIVDFIPNAFERRPDSVRPDMDEFSTLASSRPPVEIYLTRSEHRTDR